jgi:hypothetical protein
MDIKDCHKIAGKDMVSVSSYQFPLNLTKFKDALIFSLTFSGSSYHIEILKGSLNDQYTHFIFICVSFFHFLSSSYKFDTAMMHLTFSNVFLVMN